MLRNVRTPVHSAHQCLKSSFFLKRSHSSGGDSRFHKASPIEHSNNGLRNASGSHTRQGKRASGSSPRQKPQEKHLLRPYTLAVRLQKLCAADKWDKAVFMLENAPLDAQTTTVWNTLINNFSKVQRHKAAYRLYIEMKRRGFIPNTRTYITLFNGMHHITYWPKHHLLLENAHKLYESYKAYLKKGIFDPSSVRFLHAPVASYIKILSKAGKYQEMFDVCYELKKETSVTPNQFIYTALFQALLERRTPSTVDGMDIDAQNASDAKLLWRQMVKESHMSSDFLVDSCVVNTVLKVLSRGRAIDQTFAFGIIREYIGLAKPGEEHQAGLFPLEPNTLHTVLVVCNQMRKPRLCIYFANQVINRERESKNPTTRNWLMDEVLLAYATISHTGSTTESANALETIKWMLAEGAFRDEIAPTSSSYAFALMSCWRCGDWDTAREVFRLMSALNPEDFSDESVLAGVIPQLERKKNISSMTARAASALARAALATNSLPSCRQCLRMMDHVGLGDLLDDRAKQSYIKPTVIGIQGEQSVEYYAYKMASAVAVMVDLVLPLNGRNPSDMKKSLNAQEKRWRVLRSKAKQFLRQNPAPKDRPTVEDELMYKPHIAAVNSVVDFEMAKRLT